MFKVICLLAILSVVYCASVPPLEKTIESAGAADNGDLEQSPPISPETADDLEKSEFFWGGWGRRYGGWGGYGYRSYGYPRYYGGWGYPTYYRSYNYW